MHEFKEKLTEQFWRNGRKSAILATFGPFGPKFRAF